MPSDVCPRSLPFLISVPSAKRDLWYATGTICPTATLVAAVTICFVTGSPSSVKHSTWHTCNLSASGCFVISTIFPVYIFLIPVSQLITSSTGIPACVKASANS